MPALPDHFKTDESKVRGCASQVWLVSRTDKDASGRTIIVFQGESDAMIVRGLIAILLELYSGRCADEILAVDAHRVLADLGLDTHLSQQRSNGLFAMVERIRADARALSTAGA